MVIILLQKKKEKTWSLYFFCTQEETTNIFGLLVHLKTIANSHINLFLFWIQPDHHKKMIHLINNLINKLMESNTGEP